MDSTLFNPPGWEDFGITLLMNESISTSNSDQTMWLVGVDDPH